MMGVLAAILLQNWKEFLVWEELFHLCKSDCWNENLTTLCQGVDSLTPWPIPCDGFGLDPKV